MTKDTRICDKEKINSVQSLSRVRCSVTPWTVAHQASLFIANSQSLLKLMSIELVKPSNHLIPIIPFSSCLQSFPAGGAFPSHQVAKVLELQLQHQSFQWPRPQGVCLSKFEWPLEPTTFSSIWRQIQPMGYSS